MEPLPFTLDLGVSTVHGLLRLGEESLGIEWRVFDALGRSKGPTTSIDVPYGELVGADYAGRLVGARVSISARGGAVFGELPMPEGDITSLKAGVKRRYREQARGWAAEAALRIAEADNG